MDSPTPRLTISKLVLHNFKSYGGTVPVEIGPFHKCFSAIVGPNGSGKSNVIDALLFVFGKRAKQIRLNKVSELIHNSPKYRNLTSARVDVYFEEIVDKPNEEFDVVQGSQFVVSREAYKDNTSKYFLNNKSSTFTEVTKLLKSKRIDLDNNRFLILQGEVELISMMKPKAPNPHEDGLLEYIEDIIGTDAYVEPIDEAMKQVEELNEERTHMLNRVKAVEKEREGLEGAKQEAEEYLSKEAEKQRQHLILYQIYRSEAQAYADETTEKKNAMVEKLEKEREKLSAAAEKADEYAKLHDTERKEHEALEKEVDKAKAVFEKYEREDIKLREDKNYNKLKIKKTKASMEKDRAKAATCDETVESSGEVVIQNKKRVEVLRKKLTQEQEKLDEAYESIREETEGLRVQLEAAQEKAAPFLKTVTEAKSKVDLTRTELDIASGEASNATRQLEEARSKLSGAVEEEKKCVSEVDNLGKDRQTKQARLTAAKKELSDTERSEEAVGEELSSLRSRLEASRAASAALESKSGVIKMLMKEKTSGRMPGVFGRLGDLGAIEAKYDVAVTTACGALDNIVVDNTDTAQKCVELLRQREVGRATFIILDKLDQARAEMDSGAPTVAPRLFDLVQPAHERFRPAFYHALRNTLVAPSLDEASKIAYGGSRRHRVVSLQGDLLDTSGAMSGGGRRVLSGGMTIVGRKGASLAAAAAAADGAEDLSPEELQNRLSSCEGKLRQLRETRAALETEIESLEKALYALETELKKATMKAKGAQERAVELRKRLPDLEAAAAKEAKAGTGKAATLRKRLAEEEAKLSAANTAASKYQKAVADLEAKIASAGASKINSQKQKVDDLESQIEGLEKEASKAEAQAKAAAKAGEKARAAVTKAEKELEQTQAEMERIETKLEGMVDDATRLQDAYEEVGRQLKEKLTKLESIAAEYERARKQHANIRAVEVDIVNQVDDYSRVIKENSTKVSHWSKKIASILKKADQLAAYGEDECEELTVTGSGSGAEGSEETTNDSNDADNGNDTNGGEGGSEDNDDNVMDADEAELTLAQKRGFRELTAQELARYSKNKVQNDITMLEEQIAALKPNLEAIRQYRKKEKEYLSRVGELDAMTDKRDAKRKLYDDLRKKRLDEFMAGFNIISMKLKEMYQMITLGGDAELELLDSLDPFSEGIVFSVRPPKKSWKNISNLSGGEKTLSSLALVFALHYFKPTPLYFMDEIDAALDFRNVSIVGTYIKERTKNAQFIIISLRNNMFELADRLVGIYKTDNTTKSVTINPAAFVTPAGTLAPAAGTSPSGDASVEAVEEDVMMASPAAAAARPIAVI